MPLGPSGVPKFWLNPQRRGFGAPIKAGQIPPLQPPPGQCGVHDARTSGGTSLAGGTSLKKDGISRHQHVAGMRNSPTTDLATSQVQQHSTCTRTCRAALGRAASKKGAPDRRHDCRAFRERRSRSLRAERFPCVGDGLGRKETSPPACKKHAAGPSRMLRKCCRPPRPPSLICG